MLVKSTFSFRDLVRAKEHAQWAVNTFRDQSAKDAPAPLAEEALKDLWAAIAHITGHAEWLPRSEVDALLEIATTPAAPPAEAPAEGAPEPTPIRRKREAA